MPRLKILKPFLLLLFFVGTSTLCWGEFNFLSVEKQYEEATSVVRAKMLKEHPISVGQFIEYTLFEFEVLEEFKGKIYGQGDKGSKIVIICQTKYDWECPQSVVFQKEKEYILFLFQTPSGYLYTLVTDKQGSSESTKELLREIKGLKKSFHSAGAPRL